MPLNIKNPEVERLVDEVASLTGESKTEAVRKSLEQRLRKLALSEASSNKVARLRRFLEREVWPAMPESELGRRLTREEEERILGFGRDGV